MILLSPAASIAFSGSGSKFDAGSVIKRIRIMNRDSAVVAQELSEAPDPDILFMSSDPTDNSVVVQAKDSDAMSALIQRLETLDRKLDLAYILSARKTYACADAFLEFSGPGRVDSGSDTISIEPGSVLAVRLMPTKDAGFVVVFRGTGDKGTSIQIDSGDGAAGSLKPLSGDEKEVNARAIVPANPNASRAVVRCTVSVGNFVVKQLSILRS